MPKAAFTTLGCKVNQYETQRILDDFEAYGFEITEFNKCADIYVINTCSVTQAAEKKSRAIIRRAARLNSDAVVIVTGCYGEMANIKNESIPEAGLLVPNHKKLQTLEHLIASHPRLAQTARAAIAPGASSSRPSRTATRTRATLKVQDGCNVFCSFCSIPQTRKFMISRTIEELVDEATTMAANGFKEIVITGVLVGAFGQDRFTAQPVTQLPRIDLRSIHNPFEIDGPEPEPDLALLLLQLARVQGIERIRLSSIEPTQVTDRLIAAFMLEPKLCPHLHIPLQSGDSEVLFGMNRPYDRDFYIERCNHALACIPNLAITTDIMVGFPGEDEAAFQNTVDVVQQVKFARAHIFRYSPRPNTDAAEMEDHVSEEIKQERAIRLAEVCREVQRQFVATYIGKSLPVLVEGRTAVNNAGDEAVSMASEVLGSATDGGSSGMLLSGYTSNYIRVQFAGGSHLAGTIQEVTLLEPSGDGAIGSVGDAHFAADEPPPDATFIPLTTFAAQLTQLPNTGLQFDRLPLS